MEQQSPEAPREYKEALIYVVDDEPMVRMLGEAALGTFGYSNIKTFENGQVALDAIKEAASKGEMTPDLIITDVNMPKMDGGQLLEEIEKLDLPKTPTSIYLTGRTEESNVRGVKERAFRGLAKPYSPTKDLIPLVREALQHHFQEKPEA